MRPRLESPVPFASHTTTRKVGKSRQKLRVRQRQWVNNVVPLCCHRCFVKVMWQIFRLPTKPGAGKRQRRDPTSRVGHADDSTTTTTTTTLIEEDCG